MDFFSYNFLGETMDNTQFIKPELLVLIPVLNMVGTMIKASHINNKYIPCILGLFGVAFCIMYEMIQGNDKQLLSLIFDNLIQGILIASVSVYGHQMYCQNKKKSA